MPDRPDLHRRGEIAERLARAGEEIQVPRAAGAGGGLLSTALSKLGFAGDFVPNHSQNRSVVNAASVETKIYSWFQHRYPDGPQWTSRDFGCFRDAPLELR